MSCLEIWLVLVWYNLFFNFLKMLFQKIVPGEKWGFEKLEKKWDFKLLSRMGTY